MLILTSLALGVAPASAEVLVVAYDAGTGPRDRAAVRADADARLLTREPGGLERLSVGDAARALAEIDEHPRVRAAGIERRLRTASAIEPNDPWLAAQWSLRNTGQIVEGISGTPGADARLFDAWAQQSGSPAVTVGVVDTGLNVSDPELAAAQWRNPGETAGNGIDDDGNGFLDDVHGWNVVARDGGVFPPGADSHGHQVASVIGADRDNGIGMAGAARVKVLPVQAFTGESATTTDVYAAARYAADHGARIVNLSLGGEIDEPGDPFTALDLEVFRDFPEVLFVVAAGNSGRNLDAPDLHALPCELAAANIICVGASTPTDTRADFSNYGTGAVDLTAPGVGIVTRDPRSADALLADGTSVAAPLVSGAAALIASAHPEMRSVGLRGSLIEGGDLRPALAQLGTSRRLNALGALQAAAARPAPALITPPAITGTAQPGAVLSASAGTWSGATETLLRWDVCTAQGACRRVAGAYGPTLPLRAADAGKRIRLVVHAQNAASSTVASSTPVEVVAPPAGPPGSGATAPVGSASPAPTATGPPLGLALPRRVSLSSRRPVIALRCLSVRGCRGRLSLRLRRTPLGDARFSITGRGQEVVRLRLTRLGRRVLARGPRTVTVDIRMSGQAPVVGSLRVSLRR